MSRTYAHSRRQVRSLVPALRGIGRRAARGGVGWKVRTVGGSQTQSAALCSTEGGSKRKSAALCSTEGGSRAYLTPLSRLEHLARSLCPKGLLVLAHMWKDWLPHLKGSITAEAEEWGAVKALLP